jgi:hypothetical protein
MFDRFVTAFDASGTVGEWARVEAAATARRLAAMVVLLDQAYAADGSADREQWYLDNWGAVAAEIGAEQNITQGAASHQLLIATALRDRLPHVAALFADGLVSYRVVSAITARTALVRDRDAQKAVDKALADVLTDWAPMSEEKLNTAIDAIVAEHDPHGVYRTKLSAKGRNIQFDYDGSGMATMFGTLFATDAKAYEKRLNVLARTVCPGDPRTVEQRRADAVHSITHALDYLPCLCGSDDCPGPTTPPKGNAVVYVVVNEDTLDDASDAAAAQDAALDGDPDPLFDKPLSEITTWDELSGDTDAARGIKAEATDSYIGVGDADGSDGHRDGAGANAGDEAADASVRPEWGSDPGAAGCAAPAGCGADDHAADDTPYSGGAAVHTNHDQPATRPGAILGGPFLSGSLARRFALTAKICKVCNPGDAPPELATPHRAGWRSSCDGETSRAACRAARNRPPKPTSTTRSLSRSDLRARRASNARAVDISHTRHSANSVVGLVVFTCAECRPVRGGWSATTQYRAPSHPKENPHGNRPRWVRDVVHDVKEVIFRTIGCCRELPVFKRHCPRADLLNALTSIFRRGLAMSYGTPPG